jgi:hypothetical protein
MYRAHLPEFSPRETLCTRRVGVRGDGGVNQQDLGLGSRSRNLHDFMPATRCLHSR